MMDIGEQYGLSDLRHLISQPFTAHRNLPPPHYGLFLVGAAAADKVEEVALSPPPNPIHESPPPHSPLPPGPPPAPLQHQQVGVDLFPGFAEESDHGGCPPATGVGVGVQGGNGDGRPGGGGTSGVGGCSQSHGRWPRQETLTLLEIRSRLDSKFKEAAQKAPLWDEVSRIMAEEHGYHRSGKKCREKLENLYKYYKKTKDGKAGRHDGKHYRFFRQLEALYGENSNSTPAAQAADMNINVVEYPAASFQMLADHPSNQLETLQALKHYCGNLSFSSSSAFDGSSSEGDDDSRKGGEAEVAGVVVGGTTADPYPAGETRHGGVGRVKRGRASWKAKMREFVDLQLKRFMAVQEAWVERMLATLEHREQERMSREEEWRNQEAARFEQEHKFWAKERAWIEARDAALIEALEKLSGGAGGCKAPTPEDVSTSVDGADEDSDNRNNDSEALDGTANNRRWPEAEVTCLIQLRTGMEGRFQEGGCPNKNALWEEISTRMGARGYERSAKRCKEKWENTNKCFRRRTNKCHKKRKENSRTCPYYKHLDSLYYTPQGSEVDVDDHRGNVAAAEVVGPLTDEVATPSDSNVDAAAVAAHEACSFPFLFDGEGLWEANAGMDVGGGPGQH